MIDLLHLFHPCMVNLHAIIIGPYIYMCVCVHIIITWFNTGIFFKFFFIQLEKKML